MSSPQTIAFDFAASAGVLDQVVDLGDRNSRTLGFLPYAGFRAAAEEGRIAVACADDGRVLGYCLFDLPREVVRIVQLCVSDSARNTGLARTLVEAVSARHADRLGLVLKCRADWPADKLWPRLGFVAQTQVRGRSREGHPLTVWWRSHGHADLFTLLEEFKAGSRPAAIDSNIYCDLHSAKTRQGSKHSAVLAPLVADGELNVALLPSVEGEIYATKDAAERTRFLNAKVNYTRATKAHTGGIVDHLLAKVPNNVLARDGSLQFDAKVIAEAHVNGIDLFITRDDGAIKYLADPAASIGVEVLHPTEVPTYLDVEQARHAYQPAQLEETTFTIRRLDRALTANELDLILDKSEGERLTDLRHAIADLAGRSTADIQRSVLSDADGALYAVWAAQQAATLAVPLLRIANGRLQTTLAAQLSRMLRMEAIALALPVIRITDCHLHKAVRVILEADGFYADTDGLFALTLPLIGSWPDVSATAQQAAEENGAEALLRLLDLPESPSVAQTVEFERIWAPAKILGQGIKNYILPIKPPFASQLLGYPASLLSRPDDLGLSREHVYYSSRRGHVKPPARILWYISGETERCVIASSNLAETRVDTPRRLHRAYARLGVWDLHDIERAASSGKAAAFRFIDTELFSTPVDLDRVRALAPKGRSLLLRSAQELEDDWYERIYREGVRR